MVFNIYNNLLYNLYINLKELNFIKTNKSLVKVLKIIYFFVLMLLFTSTLYFLLNRLPSINNPSKININSVPYISTYYIKPIVKPNEEVKIDFYITDFYHNEYLNETYDESFNLSVKINDIFYKTFYNLKAGDNTISLGSFLTEGEIEFSMLCTDMYNRHSHELINTFMVKNDTDEKEYVMTKNDLQLYNIKNDGSDYEERVFVTVDKLTDSTHNTLIEKVANSTTVPSKKYICFIGTTGNNSLTTAKKYWLNTIVKYSDDYDKEYVYQESKNTRIGLQQLIADKKSEGYNKLTLLPGIYRIDNWTEKDQNDNFTGSESITIPDNFTLDLNGATIKQNEFTGCSSTMIVINKNNAHLVNGTIEGDYFAHDYTNSPNNSEWVVGVNMNTGDYMSLENITIKDITGYGFGSSVGNLIYGIDIWQTNFELGDINTETGKDFESNIRRTSEPIDISNIVKYKYISINKYLGYQGINGAAWNLILHYYDENNKYIGNVNSYQYRLSKIPPNAKYLRITTLSNVEISGMWLTYFDVSKNCWIKNSKFENCRCVGTAGPAGMNNSIFEDCEWTLNGQSGAFSALDAEDGWDMMQDFTCRRANFHNNYRNDYLICAGHNFIVEDMINGSVYFWPRANSYVIRNSVIYTANLRVDSRELTGYSRIYNNKIKNGIIINSANESFWGLCVKDCNIYGIINSSSSTSLFLRCNIYKNSYQKESLSNLLNGIFKKCNISERNTSHNSNSKFYHCTIDNLHEETTTGNNYYEQCYISNSNIKFLGNSDSPLILKNCTIKDLQLQSWGATPYLIIDNCTINNNIELISIDICNMNKPIVLSNNKIDITSKTGLMNIKNSCNISSPGDTITLNNNNISLYNSSYVINSASLSINDNISINSTNNNICPASASILNSDNQ